MAGVRATATGRVERRFESAVIDTSRSMDLAASNPALTEDRTIFPSTVVGTMESPRFLVSGANNPKLGKAVVKGPRTGWPIYHVTLEERATCPRSCHAWASCYGNSMPFARRHGPDADFIEALKAEVLTVARQHPEGMLVRLHTLGDFYSVEYVRTWRDLLLRLPQLHVFGYTARTSDAPDVLTRSIANEINRLAERSWDRFAIRVSRPEAGPERSIIVDEDPGLPDVIVCPAQTHKTEACASCGLCWAEAARDKTIAFLRHGMKSSAGLARVARAPRESQGAVVRKRRAGRAQAALDAVRSALQSLYEHFPSGARAGDIMAATGLSYQRAVDTARDLAANGEVQWVYAGVRSAKMLLAPGVVFAKPGGALAWHDHKPSAPGEPKAAPEAAAPRPPVARTVPVARVIETHRQRMREVLDVHGGVPRRREEIGRGEPAGAMTRRIMGDPDPGQLVASEMSAEDIAKHNAAILRKLPGSAKADLELFDQAVK